MSHSDAVHPAAAPDQAVQRVKAVSREGTRQDPREEDQADPPAAVVHLEDEAEAEEEEEVGHDVLFIPVDQTVGQVAPGLIPVITENKQVISQISSVILPVKTQTVGELWVVRFCEVDYYDQQGNCGDEDRWRPLFYYLGIRNNSEVLEQTPHRLISKPKKL